jgi:hypothetical protein
MTSDHVAAAATFGNVQTSAARRIAGHRFRGSRPERSNVYRPARHLPIRHLPEGGHFGHDAFGDNFPQSIFIGRMVELGTMQVWTSSSATGLPMAQRALRFEQFFTPGGIPGWLSRSLRESVGNNEGGLSPSHNASSIPVPSMNEKRENLIQW